MFELLPKQKEALVYLRNNNEANIILYGGAAGGGKTRLGCFWQIQRRIKYPGTRSVIGRAKLSTLKETTLPSFFDTARSLGLIPGYHFVYNQQSSKISFANGSEILLVDLMYKPSDPHYTDLGGLEITDAFIDEALEVHERGIVTLSSRIRYKLNWFCGKCSAPGLSSGLITQIDEDNRPYEWQCKKCKCNDTGLRVKQLLTTNPGKGYLFNEFYDPYKKGTLAKGKAFIQSLAIDNPTLSREYIEILKSMPEIERKRLLEGEWEFDSNADRLYSYEELLRAFRPNEDTRGVMYITCDVARLGKDRTVICLWNGLHLVRMVILNKKTITEVVEEIQSMQRASGVALKNIICDEDGIGGGVCDVLRCRGFVNGSRAVRPTYANLKSDCYFKLGELIDSNKVTFNPAYRDAISKELEWVRRAKLFTDGKLAVTDKKTIASLTGGMSPDIADAVMLRSYFELHGGSGQVGIGGHR
jgi:phage terminase large subunit